MYLNLNPSLSILVPDGRYKLMTEKLSKSILRFLPSLSIYSIPVPYTIFLGSFLDIIPTPL